MDRSASGGLLGSGKRQRFSMTKTNHPEGITKVSFRGVESRVAPTDDTVWSRDIMDWGLTVHILGRRRYMTNKLADNFQPS